MATQPSLFAAIAPERPASTPASAPPRAQSMRVVVVTVLSLLGLGALPRMVALAGAGMTASFLLANGVVLVLGWGPARLAGVPLPPLAARPAAVAAGLGQGAFVIGWIVLALALGHRLTGGAQGGASVSGLLLGAGLLVLQTAGEEVFFRGWVQGALCRVMPVGAALPLGALVFALAHLAGAPRSSLSVVILTLTGLWFGLLARGSGGLAMPIAAHWACNLIELVLLGLYPNPGVWPWGAWRDYDITGPVIWGGGPEGDSASLVAAIVTLGAVLFNLGRRRPRQAP